MEKAVRKALDGNHHRATISLDSAAEISWRWLLFLVVPKGPLEDKVWDRRTRPVGGKADNHHNGEVNSLLPGCSAGDGISLATTASPV